MPEIINLKKYKNKYRTDSIRLTGYDYSSEGVYFITILTKYRVHYFGSVSDGKMNLSTAGQIVAQEWLKTFIKRERAVIGEWVVMPNHFHALIGLKPNPVKDASHASLTSTNRLKKDSDRYNLSIQDEVSALNYKNSFGPQSDNLSSIVRGFKGACTRQIRNTAVPEFKWHTGFYDHIVRNQASMTRIEEYIMENPLKWNKDRFYN